MNRKDFLIKACTGCLGFSSIITGLTSCKAASGITGKITENGVMLHSDDFLLDKSRYRSWLVVQNEKLAFPIYVYRFTDQEYSAVWMQCTHQGAELNSVGDQLQCPAHGSMFNNKGEVIGGPAERMLRTFPVTVTNNQVFIDLRKV